MLDRTRGATGQRSWSFTDAEGCREKQGADAWQKMLGFLERHLKRRSARAS